MMKKELDSASEHGLFVEGIIREIDRGYHSLNMVSDESKTPVIPTGCRAV
jgi:hypothetical protein